MPNEQYLSLTERDRRYKLVRQAMKERGMEALLVWGDSGKWDWKMANIHYLSGIGGNGDEGLMVFPLEGDPTIVLWSGAMWSFVKAWKEYSSWVTDFRARDDGTYSKAVLKILNEKHLAGAKIGVCGLLQQDSIMFPSGIATALRSELPKAQLVDASGLIEEIRLVKSDEEIALMEKATRIGEAALATVAEVARPGVPENEVVAAMFKTMLSQGADLPIMFLWNSGVPPYVARLVFTSRRPLKDGDIIVIEFSPRFHGYCSHLNQSVVIGDWPDKEWENLYHAALATNRAGLKALKPGATLAAVQDACRKALDATGYKWNEGGAPGGFRYGSAMFHGEGLGNENLGGMARTEKERQSQIIKIGQTFAFEAGACSLDNSKGINMGNIVVTTPGGARPLTTKEPEIIICR
jgi:Xaa-Pro aminopeptidase